MSDETRVVLVKPGDKLLIGNIGDLGLTVEEVEKVHEGLRRILGLQVVIFAADIDMGLLEGDPPHRHDRDGAMTRMVCPVCGGAFIDCSGCDETRCECEEVER